MSEKSGTATDAGEFDNRARYNDLMAIVKDRKTARAFDASYVVPGEHYDLILEAARHAPSGANAQPWHFIVVRDEAVKRQIADYFVGEQRRRAKLKMKFPTPNYRGLEGAPGLIVVATDFRWTRAFPVLNDGSELDRLYQANAERILLQSVAAATMSAHLAAAALGYSVWWVTAIGQENAQAELKPLLDVPDEIAVIDIMAFGPPRDAPYSRWKKSLDDIRHFDRFERGSLSSVEDIDDWVKTRRHKVMYRSADKVDLGI